MANFKFDLSDDQVKLLGTILSNYVSICSRLKISHPSIGVDFELAEVLCIAHELSIQFQDYYGSRSIKSSRD